MEKRICYIVGAGKGFSPFEKKEGDFVIAADGGLDYLTKKGITPDLTVGDFDSVSLPPKNGRILRLKKEKDDTDTLSAIRVGIAEGYKEFVIMGGVGGRLSHTVANIQCLKLLSDSGCNGELIGEGSLMTVITDGTRAFEGKGGYISVFSLSDKAYGVNLSGVKYPLSSATISNTFPIGVSNEFSDEKALVSVEKGSLLIIIEFLQQ